MRTLAGSLFLLIPDDAVFYLTMSSDSAIRVDGRSVLVLHDEPNVAAVVAAPTRDRVLRRLVGQKLVRQQHLLPDVCYA